MALLLRDMITIVMLCDCVQDTNIETESPALFLITRQAKLFSKPSAVMKEVNLQDKGENRE